jgi:dienelactone hydrolase
MNLLRFSRQLPVTLSVLVSIACASAREIAIHKADSLPASTPWDLAALSKAPVFDWSDGVDVRSMFYQGEPYQGKPTRVFAYYATPGTLAGDPAKDKNLPGIVLVHGGGGKAFAKWAELWASRGYAAIAMDLSGSGPDGKRLADGGPDQGDGTKFRTEAPATDAWTYHAVANVIRAHSLLLSFPEVDARRTAVTGISWGGYLTCIVAGLDDRFKAAVPVYGSGFLHENSCWLDRFEKMSDEARANWVRLWDPSMYVGSASMPMLFVNGGRDFAYPPDSHAKTYALVKSPKNLHFVPDLPHGHIFDRPPAIEVFIRQSLEGGIPLARIGEPRIEGDQITATVETQTKLVKAELHYTLDPLPGTPNTRQWTSLPAVIADGRIQSKLPPENATIWFLTVEDERKALVSSRLVVSSPLPPKD